MNDSSLILILAIATLVAALIYGAMQLIKVQRAKVKHTHSAMTAADPHARAEDGAPGVAPRP